MNEIKETLARASFLTEDQNKKCHVIFTSMRCGFFKFKHFKKMYKGLFGGGKKEKSTWKFLKRQIKFFYKAQGVELVNNQYRNKTITVPVYTCSIHRVQTHI